MADELSSTIMGCTQVSIANKITESLAVWEPSFDLRLLYTVSACVLALTNNDSTNVAGSDIVVEIVLAVTTTTILSYLAIQGYNTMPIFIAQSCTIILFGEVIGGGVLGRLTKTFSTNIKYIFANTVSRVILSQAGPALCVTTACVAMFIGSRSSGALGQASGLAGLNVLKSMLMNSIPPILKLPTVTAIVCFANPLQGMGMGASTLFGFALYQASNSLQEMLLLNVSMAQAVFISAALTLCAPTPVFQALGKITLSSVCTEAFLQVVQEASDTDPFLCLTALMVVLKVVVSVLEGYHQH
jgi:hypothetical protein